MPPSYSVTFCGQKWGFCGMRVVYDWNACLGAARNEPGSTQLCLAFALAELKGRLRLIYCDTDGAHYDLFAVRLFRHHFLHVFVSLGQANERVPALHPLPKMSRIQPYNHTLQPDSPPYKCACVCLSPPTQHLLS